MYYPTIIEDMNKAISSYNIKVSNEDRDLAVELVAWDCGCGANLSIGLCVKALYEIAGTKAFPRAKEVVEECYCGYCEYCIPKEDFFDRF